MKKYAVLMTLLVLGLVGVSFFLMNFNVSSSQTQQNSSLSTSNPAPLNAPKAMAPTETQLVVAGSGRLESTLRDELARQLKGNAALGDLQVVEAGQAAGGKALLYIQIKERDVRWTPVYSTAALQVVAAYSQSGDVSFKDDDPVQFQSGVQQFKGVYKIEDASTGLMSLPGYEDFLAKKAAQTIVESVLTQFQ